MHGGKRSPTRLLLAFLLFPLPFSLAEGAGDVRRHGRKRSPTRLLLARLLFPLPFSLAGNDCHAS